MILLLFFLVYWIGYGHFSCLLYPGKVSLQCVHCVQYLQCVIVEFIELIGQVAPVGLEAALQEQILLFRLFLFVLFIIGRGI